MSLAHNAVAHTGEGDAVALGVGRRGGDAYLWVRDTGPGVALEDQEPIFERFARGRGERGYQGTGLGLAIVRAIADAHHGRVELESALGEGARFTVVVPVDQPYEAVGA